MVTSARKVVKARDKDPKLATSRRRSFRGNKVPSTSSINLSSSSGTAKVCWDDRNWKLFLTTANRVCVWDDAFCATVFTSGSEGILTAKRSKDGAILAVADAQIVILHKVDQGQHQSYRLKGAEGNCRLLQYAPDSKALFFTDSIHNAVQTYSLREDRVSEAAKAHPSVITSFCVSPDSNFLLSCSADPPVIQLHNRQLNNTIDIKPKASAKPVVCCAFHPTRKSIFVLAFADGILAAYDSTRLVRGDKARTTERKGNVGSGGGEHIHSFGHLHDASISGGAGITGVEFIPGYRARAVSVGEDGRLFIVDFEKRDVLVSWHVGAPATSVSVRPAVGKDAGKSSGDAGWMVAVGTIHGMCFVFDGGGTKVCEQTVDAEARKVLDVEWISGEVALPPGTDGRDSTPSSPSSTVKSPSSSRYLDLMSSTATHALTAKFHNPTLSSLAEYSNTDSNTSSLAPFSKKTPMLPELPVLPAWQDLVGPSTVSYMNMFSPVKRKNHEKAMSAPKKESENLIDLKDPKERATEKADQRSVISAPLMWDEKPIGKKHGPIPVSSIGASSLALTMLDGHGSKDMSGAASKINLSGTSVVSITHEPGSGTSVAPVKSALIPVTTVTDPGKLLSDIRSIRGETNKGSGTRGLALFAPYMPARPNSRRGLLKSFGGVKSVDSLEDESTLSISGVHSEAQTKSVENASEANSYVLDESTMKDDIMPMEERVGHSSDEVQGGEEPVSEFMLEPLEEAMEESFDEADIWLMQGLDEDDLPTPKPKSMEHSTTLKKVGLLKRKLPAGNEYESDGFTSSIRKGTGNSKGSNLGSKLSAGTGSVRSFSGSNKYQKIGSAWNKDREDIDNSKRIVDREATSGATMVRPVAGKVVNVTASSSSSRTVQPAHDSSQPVTGEASSQSHTLNAGWEEAMTRLSLEVRNDIRAMHEDMIKRFEEQRRMLEEVSRENVAVRTENEKLRRELFDLMGSRSRTVSGTFSGTQGK
ncbi:WD40-repeat-containing domain protein [Tirmania nivea]|nr:WD40-repeat-containing domain protein [Tirmania nivea]